ncbi:hypothetical protein N657DRAFT_693862 [Parathielavia appendiculata]|uniref:Uncharacterized protein n=1 Tax=Parathielavia appendiculata TaxID=2587402 RepID=A0AAN6TSD2_9PEZI|nr:hypothetical protein N657DRAFT_693862 [Parathielavia appendiculata]
MSITRTLNWYESEAGAKLIASNNWQLQSQDVAPITQISWTEEYALGWMAKVPTDGFRVNILGMWQPCNKGETYDINNLDFWERSSKPGEPG